MTRKYATKCESAGATIDGWHSNKSMTIVNEMLTFERSKKEVLLSGSKVMRCCPEYKESGDDCGSGVNYQNQDSQDSK